MQLLVSIIIPTFNRATIISETINSIIAQSYQNWECIIVDDGSTDNTCQVITKFAERDNRIRYYNRPSQIIKGANACRNYGFKMCNGDLVNWFDSDDVMLPEFLKSKIEYFESHVQFVIGCGFYSDQNLQNLHPMQFKPEDNLFKDYLLWKVEIFINSVVFRRSFLEDKELFLTTIRKGQETEFFSRMFFAIDPVNYRFDTAKQYIYRQHPDSKTSKSRVYNSAYRSSQALIYVELLRKSIVLKDRELFDNFYKKLIDIIFRAINNGDSKLSHQTASALLLLVRQNNPCFGLSLKLYLHLSKIVGRSSYSVERFVKSLKLNF